MKTCANCKHAVFRGGGLIRWWCEAPQNVERISAVTGKPVFRIGTWRCSEQRAPRIFRRSKFCGPDGNWFEPK